MAAIRKSSTAGNGGSDVGTTFLDLLDVEVEALWKCVPTYLPTISGTNTITATSDTALVAAIAAYARPMAFWFKAAATNTTAVTINIDTIGAKSIKDNTGTALAAGMIVLNSYYLIVYNGTDFIIINPTSTTTGNLPGYQAQGQQASGTAGGTFTSGAWQTRILNTEVRDTIGVAAISSNTFTLPAGTYSFEWSAPACDVDIHQSRLFNVTDSAVVAYGSNTGSVNSEVMTESQGTAVVTISGAKAFRIEHRCQTTTATTGFGKAGSFGNIEVYTQVSVWRQ